MKRWFTTILVSTLLLTVQACSSASGGDTPQVPVASKPTMSTGMIRAALGYLSGR
jgi:hypothetical protein